MDQTTETNPCDDLFESLCQHLDALGLAFEADARGEAIRFQMKGVNGRQFVLLRSFNANQVVIIRCRLEGNAPTNRLAALSELIARANFGFRIGSFQLDFSDGEIAFASGIELRDGVLTRRMVEGLVTTAVSTTERHIPAFEDVIAMRRAPAEALSALGD